jgi:hypothetical protein
MWNNYKDRTDKFGYSFKQAIFSGCQNTDSGIGVYAGTPDCYTAFNDLFNAIIEDYHKFPGSAKHISDLNSANLKAPPFEPHEAALIKSTRIRIARSKADTRLGGSISKEDRLADEKTVESLFANFTGDLAGKYYSLASLTPEQRQQLIDDHFLFKEGDRFLEACGLNRDWPSGRGIFHNEAKTFLIWFNEEDHFRIISM